MRTCAFGVRRVSSTSGVPPTRSSSEGASLAATAGHGREENDRLAFADRRVEPVEGADVLALEVDVHERGDLLVPVEELGAQLREATGEIVEHLANRAPGCGHLALAADGGAQRGRDADGRHTCSSGLPAQNST